MGALTFLARIKVHAIAVLGGLVVAFAVILLIEMAGHAIWPPPSDVDVSDLGELGAALEGAPVGSLLFVLLAWTLGTGCGAWVAARLVGPTLSAARAIFSAIGMGRASAQLEPGPMPMIDALVVGTILMFAGVSNLVMLPHPVWFNVVGVVVFLPSAWIGGMLAMRG
jgi:hypothetical protein